MLASFGRHEAPVLADVPGLVPGEAVFVVAGQFANQKGQPLVSEWIAIPSWGSDAMDVEPFAEFVERIGLGRTPFANIGAEVDVQQLTAVSRSGRARPDVGGGRGAELRRRYGS